jgi:hypothetical protein
MIAALVAAPAVAKAATVSSVWGEAAVVVPRFPASLMGGANIGVIQMFATTERDIQRMLSYVRVSDCRWVNLQNAKANGRYTESLPVVDDGSQQPLRFNEHGTFIEPMVSASVDTGIQWSMNPAWESAKYQVAVTPDTRFPMEYHKEVQRWPEIDRWNGRLMRSDMLHPSAQPTAVYFKR